MSKNPLIILGASTRAAARSAIRAGYQPWCIDAFADRDLRAMAPVLACPPGEYPHAMLRLLDQAPEAPVLLTGAMERYPDLLDAIAQRRPLLGSPPEAIRSVRRPEAFRTMPAIPGIQYCPIQRSASPPRETSNDHDQRWMLKSCDSAGGSGVTVWDGAAAPGPNEYLQQFVAGAPLGAAFHADENSVHLLGVTEQLIGLPEFGGKEFRYCGSIGFQASAEAVTALTHLGVSFVRHHGLRGLFGVDLILDRRDVLWPIEINPRYTASIEILERAGGMTALMPEKTFASAHPDPVCGKAIVFAREDCRAPDLYELFTSDEVADVPDVGEAVPAGRPVCTLFACGPDRGTCLARLREQAQRLYTRL